MCGFLVTCDDNLNDIVYKKSLLNIQSRGPDKSKVINEQNITFGFHRLSIIDEGDRSMQPYIYKDNILLYNGELYNYKELRENLKNTYKTEFLTKSDTEVFLKHLLIKNIDSYKDIKGMFAFALFNKKENTLKFGRDNFGIKPLYYFYDKKTLIISSSIKSIQIIKNQNINKFNLINFNKYGFTYGDNTIYDNILECRPGIEYEINFSRNDIKKRKFFSLTKFFIDKKKQIYSENYLQENIRLHLISDVKSCVLKSNGVDSNILSYFKKKIDSENNYIYFDRKLLSFFLNKNKENKKLILSNKQYRDYFEEYLNCLEYPTIDGFNTFLISKYVKNECYKVCLSGLGLDEIFDGYGINNKINLIRSIKLPIFLKQIIDLSNNIKLEKLTSNRNNKKLIDHYLEVRKITNNSFIYKNFETKEINDHNELLKELIFNNLNLKNEKELKQKELIRLYEFEFYLKNQLLKDSDYFSMENSVELRVPYIEKFFIENLIIDESENLNKREFFNKYHQNILKKLNIERKKEGFIAHKFSEFKNLKNYNDIINIVNSRFN